MRGFTGALATLALVTAAFAAFFLWQPGLDSLHDDSVSYLIMAQAYSPWHAADPVIRAALAQETYPPLFPLMIALAGGAYDWHIAHLVVAIAFGASVFLFGLHARQVTDSALLGLAAALLFALLPGSWLNAKGILSEYPYMAIVFGALAYHGGLAGRAVTRRESLILGVLLAAAFLTRSIGVMLVAAVVIAELLHAIRIRSAARIRVLVHAPLLVLVAALAWQWLRPSAPIDYLETGNVMLAAAADDPILWLTSWLAANASAMRDAWLNALMIFWGEPWKPGYLVAAALGIAGLGAMLVRAARGHADGIYGVLFLGVLLLWPYPGQMYRLLFPVVPLILLHALWAAHESLRPRYGAATGARIAVLAAIFPLAVCVPAVLFYIVERARMSDPEAANLPQRKTDIAEFYRIPSGPAAEGYAHREIEVMGDLRRIGETTPPAARVMWYTPNYVSLLARRQGVPLTRPANPAELAAQLRATNADFLYLANLHPRDNLFRQGDPLYPWLLARDFTDILWFRGEAGRRVDSALLRVDKEKLNNQKRPSS
jgi:4-amino-4-deoxy-L-arabinose transferase-like glycosyltransferase